MPETETMKRLIDAFDRAYVINLRERPDRRQEVVQEFKQAGLSIPDDKVRFYAATRPAERAQFHSIGARGVFTSHRNVLELAVKDRLRNVLVFEDDVSFRDVGERFLAKLLDQLSKTDWDLLYFGYASPPDDQLTGPLLPWKDITLGTHFYAVNGPFMARMLDYMRESEAGLASDPDNGPTSADGIHNRVRLRNPDVRVLLAAPTLAFQRSSRTDLQPVSFYDRSPLLAPAMRVTRKVKHRTRMTLDGIALRRRLSQ